MSNSSPEPDSVLINYPLGKRSTQSCCTSQSLFVSDALQQAASLSSPPLAGSSPLPDVLAVRFVAVGFPPLGEVGVAERVV